MIENNGFIRYGSQHLEADNVNMPQPFLAWNVATKFKSRRKPGNWTGFEKVVMVTTPDILLLKKIIDYE